MVNLPECSTTNGLQHTKILDVWTFYICCHLVLKRFYLVTGSFRQRAIMLPFEFESTQRLQTTKADERFKNDQAVGIL